MKAKLILTAMAMPVLFAACTSDELVPMEQTQQAERPLLSEDFKLSAKVEGQVDTRYAIVENDKTGSLKFNWENEDSYGALLIDEKVPGSDVALWPITGGTGGNTEFTYNAEKSAWIGESRIGIGKYLFVYPHAEADDERGAASYSLPTVQWLVDKLDDKTGEPAADSKFDLNGAIVRGNKAVAAKLLRQKDVEVEIELKNLYSYPKFRVNFDNGLPIETIDKIVLEKAGEFEVAGGFNHQDVWNMFKDDETDWAEKQTADFITGSNEFGYGYTTIETSKYIVAQFPKGTKVSHNKVTNNKEIEVRFMIPGALASEYKDKLSMHFYTNAGVYTIDNIYGDYSATTGLYGALAFGKSTTAEQIDRIFARNASYTLTLDKSAVDKGQDLYMVTNADDWKELVDTYGNMTTFDKTNPLQVAVVGDFAFNEDVCKFMPSKAVFEIKSSVSVKEGSVVALPNVWIDEINVPATATLNIAENFSAVTINNYGNLNCPVFEDEYALNTVNNWGTVTVEADEESGEQAEVTISALYNKAGANFINNGIATVTMPREDYGNPVGTKGNLGTVTNNATITFDEDSYNDQYGSGTEAVVGVINNNGEMYGNGELNNYSTLNQNSKVFNLKNYGLIVVGENATTNMDEDYGKVNITADFNSEFTGVDPVYLIYEHNSGTLDMKDIYTLTNLKELTINGGTVKGSERSSASGNPSQNSFGAAGTEIIINGGSFEGIKDANNKYSSFDVEVEINGNVSVKNFDFADIRINKGTTTIIGRTTAETVYLGSYDAEEEKVYSGKLIINKDQTLGVEGIEFGAVQVNKKNAIVQNNGTLTILGVYTETNHPNYDTFDDNKFTWSGNPHTPEHTTDDTWPPSHVKDVSEAAMDYAVEGWANRWTHLYEKTNANGEYYYNGDPYKYSAFISTMSYEITNPGSEWKDEYDKLTEWNDDGNQAYKWSYLVEKYTTGVNAGKYKNTSDFEEAVDGFFTNDPITTDEEDTSIEAQAEKILYGDDDTYKLDFQGKKANIYENEAAAENALLNTLAGWNSNQWGAAYTDGFLAHLRGYVWYANKQAKAANKSTEIWVKYTESYPYSYIWKDCDLYKLAGVWNTYAELMNPAPVAIDQQFLHIDHPNYNTNPATAAKLVAWVQAVLASDNASPLVKQAQKAIADLNITISNVETFKGYSEGQVEAVLNATKKDK